MKLFAQRLAAITLMSVTMAFSAPALAGENENIHEASYQIEEAMKHKTMGVAAMFKGPVEKALGYAKAALAEKPDDAHFKMLVDELEKADASVKADNAEMAAKHVEMAEKHVKMIEEAE